MSPEQRAKIEQAAQELLNAKQYHQERVQLTREAVQDRDQLQGRLRTADELIGIRIKLEKAALATRIDAANALHAALIEVKS